MKIRLESALLEQFKGGQLEVQKGKVPFGPEKDLRRGEIKEIKKDGQGNLHVQFSWLARSIGGVPPEGWEACAEVDYKLSLEDKTITLSSHPKGYDRIVIASLDMSEIAVLFPPGVSNFSQAVFVTKHKD